MKCGHKAVGEDEEGKPVCPMCLCWEVAPNVPELAGRKAKCRYCGRWMDVCGSNGEFAGLPFFKHESDMEYDTYYCGCMGWD